jgi:parallel beta-helix repeat protein
MIDCGKALITRNTIKDNYYGIMVITSIPIIENNEIIENKHHGILLLKKSRAVLTKNIIKENKGVGVFVRDHSCTLMTGCTIAENHLGFV